MQEYAVKFAEFLERTAIRVRALSVDRVSRMIKVSGLGILVGALGFAALIFLLWAVFGALEIPLTTAGAFAVLGVMLIGGGGYMWFTRSRER
jgi:hypothetical protein